MLLALSKPRRVPRPLTCDAGIVPTGDPTGTFDLRRKYSIAAGRRFRAALAALRETVVNQDILGLKPDTLSPLVLAHPAAGRTVAFQTWVDALLRKIVVEDGAWLRPMVTAAYARALRRAIRLAGRAVALSDINEAVASLVALSTVELQGIVEAVSQRVMRAAALAQINRWSPGRAFIGMEQALLRVGIPRTQAMIALMVVKSFTEGTLDHFAAVGLKRVGIVPETLKVADANGGPGARSKKKLPSRRTVQRIRKVQKSLEELGEVNVATAGDEDVCPICEDIEDENPYSIDEARSLIPAHPHCRCAFIPADETLDAMPDDDDFFENPQRYIWEPEDIVTTPTTEVGDEFNPDQPRAPKGESKGGQFVKAGALDPSLDKRAAAEKEAVELLKKDLSAPLNDKERGSLSSYCGSGYKSINYSLRNAGAKHAYEVAHIDSAMSKASTSEDRSAYRAVSQRTMDKMLAASTFVDAGYASTTMARVVAHNFGKGYKDGNYHVIRLRIPKGTKALALAGISHAKGERELLIARGSKWKISKRVGGVVRQLTLISTGHRAGDAASIEL